MLQLLCLVLIVGKLATFGQFVIEKDNFRSNNESMNLKNLSNKKVSTHCRKNDNTLDI